MRRSFSVAGRSFEVRAQIAEDGSFRAELFETAPQQRQLTLGAGLISGDVFLDMNPDEQRETSNAIILAIQQAVQLSFEQ
jgi:hypothetical protein